jgi:hypothetical protein
MAEILAGVSMRWSVSPVRLVVLDRFVDQLRKARGGVLES